MRRPPTERGEKCGSAREPRSRKGAEGHAFYSAATFYTCAEVVDLASEAGLELDVAMSCLFSAPDAEVDPSESPREGMDESAGFVGMRFTAR